VAVDVRWKALSVVFVRALETMNCDRAATYKVARTL
jgi:hypothetical protein